MLGDAGFQASPVTEEAFTLDGLALLGTMLERNSLDAAVATGYEPVKELLIVSRKAQAGWTRLPWADPMKPRPPAVARGQNWMLVNVTEDVAAWQLILKPMTA